MPAMLRRSGLAAVWVLLGACGGASGGAGFVSGDAGADAAATERVCNDGNGAPVASCPIPVAANVCARGDANACLTVTREEVVTGGAMGPCLRLVIRNGCGQETFANTCIEHHQGAGTAWQCWVSSTLAGASIDVAQCGATGRYFRYGSLSAGSLTILNSQCSTPQ